ncbi:hypothetical protein J7J90_03045 [Candidatus Micrarchaeota archaeon]|nr:hypothetical protein [Candidatus Micrarchaeota archaeon]
MTRYSINKKNIETEETNTEKDTLATTNNDTTDVKYSFYRLYPEINRKYPEYYDVVKDIVKEFDIKLGTSEESEFLQLVKDSINYYINRHGNKPSQEEARELIKKSFYHSTLWTKRSGQSYARRAPVNKNLENLREIYLYITTNLFRIGEKNKIIEENFLGIQQELHVWAKSFYQNELKQYPPDDKMKIIKSKLDNLFNKIIMYNDSHEISKEIQDLLNSYKQETTFNRLTH